MMTMSPSPKPDDKEEASLMRVFMREGAKFCDLVLYELTLTLALAFSKWAAAALLDDCLATAEGGGGVSLAGSKMSDIESPLTGVRKIIP
jgi:hypothetical protein